MNETCRGHFIHKAEGRGCSQCPSDIASLSQAVCGQDRRKTELGFLSLKQEFLPPLGSSQQCI